MGSAVQAEKTAATKARGLDEQSSHKHITLQGQKQCPSTLGTCGLGSSGRVGLQRAPTSSLARVSDAPGSEPSPSRIVCCSQPET